MKTKLTLLFMIVALASMSMAARTPRASRAGSVPHKLLVELISTGSHWDESNLTKCGFSKLVSLREVDEEAGEFSYFVYGKNAKAAITEGWHVALTPKGRHAFAIEVTLATDNDTKLYFREKADHDAFMARVRQSSKYVHEGDNEWIGSAYIQGDEYVDGGYVISFHMG